MIDHSVVVKKITHDSRNLLIHLFLKIWGTPRDTRATPILVVLRGPCKMWGIAPVPARCRASALAARLQLQFQIGLKRNLNTHRSLEDRFNFKKTGMPQGVSSLPRCLCPLFAVQSLIAVTFGVPS